jgi:hypothetical protein
VSQLNPGARDRQWALPRPDEGDGLGEVRTGRFELWRKRRSKRPCSKSRERDEVPVRTQIGTRSEGTEGEGACDGAESAWSGS